MSFEVALVGLGNIGSQVAPLLCRMTDLNKLILVDPDRYETANLSGQNISSQDLGKPKVQVMAARCRLINPNLEIVEFATAVESVPIGLLKVDVLLSCVDSRATRQTINRVAVRLARPWIDAAIDGQNMLARVATYLREEHSPCMECRLSAAHYRQSDTTYSCTGILTPPAATAAPAELGALVAAWQVIHTRRLLHGDTSQGGTELFINALTQEQYRASFAFNPDCRFDHLQLPDALIAGFSASSTVASVLERLPAQFLAVEGQRFVVDLACSSCTHQQHIKPMLIGRREARCPQCTSEMRGIGYSMRDSIRVCDVDPDISFAQLGCAAGDVVHLLVNQQDSPQTLILESDHGG